MILSYFKDSQTGQLEILFSLKGTQVLSKQAKKTKN